MSQLKVDESLPKVVIIGAGIAGISSAIAIKNQLKFSNFTIYERASAVGGTWRDNTYPGCGSDVSGHWYSLSTELNPTWSGYYVTQPEIRAYWDDLYRKHDLQNHTVLNTAVLGVKWNNSSQRYDITLENTETGEKTTTNAKAVIWAIGGFMSPMYPKDLPVGDFHGPVWHSARWRHDVSLSGKTVGVIGNGCSAAQFVPQISEDPSVNVINFCRTPQWFIARGQYRYPRFIKWAFANVPGLMRLYRNSIMAKSDMIFVVFRKTHPLIMKIIRWWFVKYIKDNAPQEYVIELIPEYPPGCKRIIADPDYLQSLKRPNVHINWTAIKKIVHEGVVLKNGDVIPLDVIIFGTGFSLEKLSISVQGRSGETVQEYYKIQGGPTAYLGMLMPGFPNLFILTGPNSASGHASLIFSHEVQIQYALQMIKPLLSGDASSFEIRADATEEYNSWLASRMGGSVWTECGSYYRGAGGTGKNFTTFPGPVTQFWWLARSPQWNHFRVVGAQKWEEKRAQKSGGCKMRKLAALVMSALVAYLLWRVDSKHQGVLRGVISHVLSIARERLSAY